MKLLLWIFLLILIVLFVCLGIIYLNSFFYHAWLYGGPPIENKPMQLRLAYIRLGQSITFFMLAIVTPWIAKKISRHY